MEVIKEAAPFIVGLFVSPVLMLAMPKNMSSRMKFWVSLFAAIVIGFLASLVAGELSKDIPDAIMSIVIDSSLVFTASPVAYKLFWKPVVGPMLNRSGVDQTQSSKL